MRIDVIIPALNEEEAVGEVVRRIPRPPVRSVLVVDNGSVDGTAGVAADAGARVIAQPRRGYGFACLAGIASLPADTEVVVFLDADGADDPSLLPRLVEPIAAGEADLVVGSRSLGRVDPGALTAPQRAGNAIAARWLRSRFGLPATDLGPFRAISRRCLDALGMTDTNYGWTVEMQIKAARHGLRYAEVAVPTFRRDRGVSKVSGTVRGVAGAAYKILGLLFYHDVLAALHRPGRRRSAPAP